MSSNVCCICCIQEDDENFDLSYQFVISNFKYHRFLDVDSHKVSRIVKG